MRSTLLAICLLAAFPAAARMYQWTNPTTGTVQLSGNPPPWYRGGHGPRVLVFEHGTLIDDTAIAVSDAQREELRGTAFGTADTSLPGPALDVAPPATSGPASPPPAAAGMPPGHSPGATSQAGATASAPPADSTAADDAKAEAFKAMLEAWDQRQVDQARAVLEGRSAPPAPTP